MNVVSVSVTALEHKSLKWPSLPIWYIELIWAIGYTGLMRSAAKREKNLLDIDGRNRITLPKELCDGIDAFAWERQEDGAIRLVPQQVVSTEDAKLLQMLKGSIGDFKAGRIKKIPKKWIDSDDEKL